MYIPLCQIQALTQSCCLEEVLLEWAAIHRRLGSITLL